MCDDDNYQPDWLTEEYLLFGSAPVDNALEWMEGSCDDHRPCESWANGPDQPQDWLLRIPFELEEHDPTVSG